MWGHSYEFENNNNWDILKNFCKTAGGREDIWYATNIEICDYISAFGLKHTMMIQDYRFFLSTPVKQLISCKTAFMAVNLKIIFC